MGKKWNGDHAGVRIENEDYDYITSEAEALGVSKKEALHRLLAAARDATEQNILLQNISARLESLEKLAGVTAKRSLGAEEAALGLAGLMSFLTPWLIEHMRDSYLTDGWYTVDTNRMGSHDFKRRQPLVEFNDKFGSEQLYSLIVEQLGGPLARNPKLFAQNFARAVIDNGLADAGLWDRSRDEWERAARGDDFSE